MHEALALRAGGPESALEAQQLAGLDALALPRPTALELASPESPAYWRACALAWNPQVRQARRELQSAIASGRAAGQPGEIEASVETLELDDLGRDTEIALTFDLLGLLGLGPAHALRASARGEVRRARAALESAVWNAMFDVERARVRLAASRERERRLERLLIEVESQSERFEILDRRGRLSEADVQMASAASHEVEHAKSHERAESAEKQAELARISGLPFDHAGYASIDGGVLNQARRIARAPDVRELLERDPALRELALEYAQAELHVRHMAAEAWPTLRLGPKLTLEPSDVLLGGVLDLSLPWPGTIEKAVRIASVEREAARERVEDALNLAQARVASLSTIEAEARMRAVEHGVLMDEAQEASWQATNARLRFGQVGVGEWTRAVRERMEPLTGLVDERESAAIAALDFAQACGVVPSSTEVAP
ncbi:MAG TPA: hypothetical protein VK843_12140 [Planctomycetota bacterium]|nr:hypothetical protein [Planctomycetota bacterium]